MTEGHHSGSDAQAAQGPGHSLWQACLDQLAQELPEQQFNTWIKPLTAQVADDFSRATVYVANRFKLDWVRAQYAGRISALLEKIYGQPVAMGAGAAVLGKALPGLTYLPPSRHLTLHPTPALRRKKPLPTACATGSTPR